MGHFVRRKGKPGAIRTPTTKVVDKNISGLLCFCRKHTNQVLDPCKLAVLNTSSTLARAGSMSYVHNGGVEGQHGRMERTPLIPSDLLFLVYWTL